MFLVELISGERFTMRSITKSEKTADLLEQKINENLKDIKHKLLVLSGKGGVGKSTVATNLAFILSLKGSDVGLLDVDIHGPSIPKMLGIEEESLLPTESGLAPVLIPPKLKVVSMGLVVHDRDAPFVWRGAAKMEMIKQFLGEIYWGKLDYLIIDLPPGTGDEPISISQLIPRCDGVIAVTTPQDVALLSVRKSINFAKKLKFPIIGIIENMSGFVCPHCFENIDLFKTGGGEEAAKDFNIPFLGKIPIDPKIAETGDEGKPFVLEYKDSPSTKAFEEIVEKIEKIVTRKKYMKFWK